MITVIDKYNRDTRKIIEILMYYARETDFISKKFY